MFSTRVYLLRTFAPASSICSRDERLKDVISSSHVRPLTSSIPMEPGGGLSSSFPGLRVEDAICSGTQILHLYL